MVKINFSELLGFDYHKWDLNDLKLSKIMVSLEVLKNMKEILRFNT